VNCVYKLCPAAMYSAVQSCCNTLSHDALHHCLSSNNNLEIFTATAGTVITLCTS